jgi:hypothetical protein
VLTEALLWPDDKWTKREPDEVNAEIWALIEAKRAELQREGESSTEAIPSQAPAAIEPEWRDGVLVLPKAPAPSDLDDRAIEGALQSLKQTLARLADDAADEHNVDKRAVRAMRRIADAIPAGVPDQSTLFTLGHAEEALRGLQSVVAGEWPDVLAADFAAALNQYDRTLRQFPRWRQFIRNAQKDTLSAEDIVQVAAAAERSAEVLKGQTVAGFIAPNIPELLLKLRGMMPSAEIVAEADERMMGGAEDLAIDLLESLDNILKRLAERAADISRSKAVKDANAEFEKRLAASLKDVAGGAGDAAPRVGTALLIYGLLTAMGVPDGFAKAAAASPWMGKFKWVKDLLDKLQKANRD